MCGRREKYSFSRSYFFFFLDKYVYLLISSKYHSCVSLAREGSEPFPANGTGEGAVAELSNGRIYYNSRRHWAPEGVNPRMRWTAWSDDCGESWEDLAVSDVLPDGPQNRDYGCVGVVKRLPVKAIDILLYSNCDSSEGRRRGTMWVSFDGGRSWPMKRLVYEGSFAYFSLSVGRPGTPSEGWIYLQFESERGCRIARFNLSWILEGQGPGMGNCRTGRLGREAHTLAAGGHYATLLETVNNLIGRGYTIKPGHVITNGMLGNIVPLETGMYRAHYGALGAVEFEVVDSG